MGDHAAPRVEAFVLGALMDADGPLLRAQTADLLAATGLQPDDFTTEPHRTAFLAIRALAERGRPTDARSVFTASMGAIADTAIDALQALQCGNAANRSALLSHAEELRRLTLLRRLESFHRSGLEQVRGSRPNPVELAQAMADFSAGYSASTDPDETGDADMLELLEEWDAHATGVRPYYLATGIEALDATIGGFVPNLNVIGGLPSTGKSALVGEVIMACLERGVRVGLFGLEDATKWLTKRHVARALGIPVGEVAASRLNEHRESLLTEAAGSITSLTRNMLVYRRAGIDAATMVQKCKHWVLNRGVQAIFVDHGGEVQHAHTGRERYDLAVAGTYRLLRDLAVNHRVPVVVLCHFNRETETQRDGIPCMQSFAETEYIARMARLALGLWVKPGDNRLRCTVLKRTEGERGITVALELDKASALVRRRGGGLIDLDAERAEARRAKASARKGGHLWQSEA